MARGGSRTAETAERAGALLHDSPLPLYYQLAQRLRRELGRAAPGARFHSDRELVAHYGLSLLTVRQAVAELVKEGLLERRHGAGTFVAPGAAKLRANGRGVKADSVLFTGWSLATLSGWEAMYFRGIVEGIQKETATRRLRIVFDEPDAGADTPPDRVLGVVALVGGRTRERAESLAQQNLRVVTINFAVPGLPSVRPDDYLGGRLAVSHLLQHGHRRLVHFNSGERETHWLEVKRAFAETAAEAGLARTRAVVLESPLRCGSIQAGYELMRQLEGRPFVPTGIVTGNDLMAMGALLRLRERGCAVPGAVSVVGFDDIEAADVCSPPLTTIAADRVELGRMAVRQLLDSSGAEERLAGVHLRMRESSGPAPRGRRR